MIKRILIILETVVIHQHKFFIINKDKYMIRRICLILLSGLMLLALFGNQLTAQQKFTLEDIFLDGKFIGEHLDDLEWVPAQRLISYVKTDSLKTLYVYDIKQKEHRRLFDTGDIPQFESLSRVRRVIPKNHYWAPDGNSLLLTNGEDFYIHTIDKAITEPLTDDANEKTFPAFSPDGKYVSFIMEHNLFIIDLSSRKLTQLTTEGAEHQLIGRFDWVYEEEFGVRQGYFWSHDSRKIAFYYMDESLEPEFPIVDFSEVHNTVETIRYPKPGDPNAIVQIGVVDIETGDKTWMQIGEETDSYIPRIQWLPDSRYLAIQRLNRQQNHLELLIADIATGVSTMILEEKEQHGWISITDDLTFLKNRDQFIWTSDRSNFQQIYLYDVNGKLLRRLTQGDWDVSSIAGVDEQNEMVYFSAGVEDPHETHLYSIGLNGKGLKRLTSRPGTHHITLSDDFKFFIDRHSDSSVPAATRLHSIDGKEITLISDSAPDSLFDYQLSSPELIKVPTEDGDFVYATIFKPIDFDSARKYPVIFEVYGGPGSCSLTKVWRSSYFLWYQYMLQHGYIIFKLDNRGTGCRGSSFAKQAYRRLGEYEVKDVIHGAIFLGKLPYIDSNRFGIWGWSYGGYVTILNMLNAADYFKVGVAVASVTSWYNYDSIYTERFMDTPANNQEGYKVADALQYADKLKGKLLMIHGTADDNVHVSNTMQLAQKFQQLNKQFDLMLYPGKEHSLYGVRYHLFEMISKYFFENL